MRVFVLYQNERHILDVNKGQSVRDVKALLRKKFDLDAVQNHEGTSDIYLALTYAGSNLEDEWIFSDIAIRTGSTLRCVLRKKVKSYLHVYCVYSTEIMAFTEAFDVYETKVADLKSMITEKTGIHVSVFRLVTRTGIEMFDCHLLKEYNVDIGDTVRMETWNGWGEFLKAATKGQLTPTMKNIVNIHDDPLVAKYQLRVALFIAAHFNYPQLAAQLLKSGARSDEPVGEHPVREWCNKDVHPDHVKTPVHEAAQRGSLTCLRQFLHHNYACILAKDANGLTPCNIARRYRQTECFKLLIAEQFRSRQMNGLTLNIYLRVRKWSERARDRAAIFHKHSPNPVLLAMENRNCKKAVVGQVVQIDGFGRNMQASTAKIQASLKLVKTAGKTRYGAGVAGTNVYLHNKTTKTGKVTKSQTNGFSINREIIEIGKSERKQQNISNDKMKSSQDVETISAKQKVAANANDQTAVLPSCCQDEKNKSANETGSHGKHNKGKKERTSYNWRDSISDESERLTTVTDEEDHGRFRNSEDQQATASMPEISSNRNLTAVKENKSFLLEDQNEYESLDEPTDNGNHGEFFVTELFTDTGVNTSSKVCNQEKDLGSVATRMPPISCNTCKECFSDLYTANDEITQKARIGKPRTASSDSEIPNINPHAHRKRHTIAGLTTRPGICRSICRTRSEDLSLQSMALYRCVTGQTIPESARASMDIAMTFSKKRWLQQIQLAIDLNANTFKRRLSDVREKRNRSLTDHNIRDHCTCNGSHSV